MSKPRIAYHAWTEYRRLQQMAAQAHFEAHGTYPTGRDPLDAYELEPAPSTTTKGAPDERIAEAMKLGTRDEQMAAMAELVVESARDFLRRSMAPLVKRIEKLEKAHG